MLAFPLSLRTSIHITLFSAAGWPGAALAVSRAARVRARCAAGGRTPVSTIIRQGRDRTARQLQNRVMWSVSYGSFGVPCRNSQATVRHGLALHLDVQNPDFTTNWRLEI